MRIGLLDADLMDHGTRHPNLALMKLSGYYKELDNDVDLIYKSYDEVNDFDEIFISKVFTFSNIPEWVIEKDNVHIGGTGFFEDGGENLPEEVEHHKPDYDLYKKYVEEQLANGRSRTVFGDYVDYSIGFATRGCFRKCAFCVNKKYDRAYRHAPITEFYDESKPYIYLWDDNVLAYPQWEDVLDELEKTGKPFQFRQGIDLRLMTDRSAYRFNHTHYHGDFIFAFDHLKDKETIIKKVQLWKRYSSKICKMYVLCGFESQDETDIEGVFQRISILMEFGCLPYIMRHEKYKTSRFRGMYIELARWCNQPQFFKKKSFREFCTANQFYKKDKKSNCAAYQTMLDFEAEFPHIAAKYFDMRFDQKNIYDRQYGYGRKYANKPLCSYCKKRGLCWENIFIEDMEIEKKFIRLYFEKEIDFQCMTYKNSECRDIDKIVDRFVQILLKYNVEEIVDIIVSSENLERVSKSNIPQFGEIVTSVYKVNEKLVKAEKEMPFEEIGYYLQKEGEEKKRTITAQKKFGENHSKMAALMDLAVIGKKGNRSTIYSSLLGNKFYKMEEKEKEDLKKRLLLRIPIIQNVFVHESIGQIDEDMNILSPATEKRRRSNVINVLKSIIEDNENLSSRIDFRNCT